MKPEFGNLDDIRISQMTHAQLKALANESGVILRKWNAQRKYDLKKWKGRFPIDYLHTVKSGLTFVETAQFLLKGEVNGNRNKGQSQR
jgi:hypothetical protein